MARKALALIALALCASAALAATDCSNIAGCKECSYVNSKKKGAVLMCTSCIEPAYTLKANKGRCDCAAGYFSRYPNGTKLNTCESTGDNAVSNSGPIHDMSNVRRECFDSSLPDVNRTRCLCKAGYYQVLGGQTPRCAPCLGTTYTDTPNVRVACKLCPLGKVANLKHTTCLTVNQAIDSITGKPNSTLADVKAIAPRALANVTAKAASTLSQTMTEAANKGKSTLTDVTTRVTSSIDDVATKLRLAGGPARVIVSDDEDEGDVVMTPADVAALKQFALEAKQEAAKLKRERQLEKEQRALDKGKVTRHGKDGVPSKKATDAPAKAGNETQPGKAQPKAGDAPKGGAVKSERSEAPAGPKKFLGIPLKGLNLTGKYEDFMERMDEKNVPVPNILGAIPPQDDIPGLEEGAKSTLDAVIKMVRSAFDDEDVQDVLQGTLRMNLHQALHGGRGGIDENGDEVEPSGMN